MGSMPRTRGSSKAVIETRRRWVSRYLVDGYAPEQIAEMLGVHRATVFRDIAAIQAANLATLRGVDADVLGAELREGYLSRKRRLAGIREEALDDGRLQVAIAEQESAEDERFLRMTQSLGLVYRAPAEITFEQRVVRVVMGLGPEQWAELEAMDDATYLKWMQKQGIVPGPRLLPPGPEEEAV